MEAAQVSPAPIPLPPLQTSAELVGVLHTYITLPRLPPTSYHPTARTPYIVPPYCAYPYIVPPYCVYPPTSYHPTVRTPISYHPTVCTPTSYHPTVRTPLHHTTLLCVPPLHRTTLPRVPPRRTTLSHVRFRKGPAALQTCSYDRWNPAVSQDKRSSVSRQACLETAASCHREQKRKCVHVRSCV